MGKIKKKREKKRRLRNLSLRMSFMVYMLVFSLLAVTLILATISIFSEQQSQLYYGHLSTLVTDESEAVEAVEATDDGYAYFYDENGILIGISREHAKMPEDMESLYNFYSIMQLACVPFWIVICLVSASFLFYRKKLSMPIQLLRDASAQIAQNNLDFQVQYDRRDEMGELVGSFERMRAALRTNQAEMWRAMEERRRLNAAFSHDLRTPLTVLHGYTELLLERLPGGELPMERVQETLAAMNGQLFRLDRYVENMQSLHRLDDVSVEAEPVDLRAFAEELRATAGLVAEAHGKAMAFEAALAMDAIRIDPGIVLRVYENLLSNAVRFARADMQVRVRAEGGVLSLSVADDGPGFSPEALLRAKDPFYSGGNTDGTHFGLGLNISDILSAKHGGGLSLENRMEGGARVVARFAEET